MTTRFRSHSLRHGRYSAAGNAYMVTTITHERHPWFFEFYAARVAIHSIQDSDRLGFSTTIAFVIMPDHIHWLFQLKGKDSLSRVVQRVKSQVSRELRKTTGAAGRVWQAGFHDHAVRSEESLVEMARYIVANPLRAGIVERVGDYPHWDCIWVGEGDVL